MIQDFSRMRIIWPYFAGKKKLVYVCLLMIPMISLLQAFHPQLFRLAIDEGISKSNESVLIRYSLLFFMTAFLEYVFRGGLSYVASIAVQSMISKMRLHVIQHLFSLSPRFHDRQLSGVLVTRSTSDFDNLSESLNQGLLSALVDIFVLISCIIGMFVLSAQLTLYIIGVIPIVLATIYFFSKALKSTMLKTRKYLASANALFQESLQARQMVKLMSAGTYVNRRYKERVERYRDMQMKSVIFDALLFSIVHGISAITLGVVFWIVSRNLAILDQLSVGVFIAFAQYIRQFFEPLKQLSTKIAMLQGVFTSLERIEQVLQFDDKLTGVQEVPKKKSGIEIQNVSFAYDDALILKGINIHLDFGKSFALVGRTGSGKSTITKLITKLYEHYEGTIKVDGLDIAQISPSLLRKNFGIVSQDVVMFAGTIAFNVCMGEPENQKRMDELAHNIGLDHTLKKMKNGWQTKINYGGTNLSLGERQLIAFARALYPDPEYIILDEATASVDPESEKLIEQATKHILKDKSAIVVAHRLNTIRECDEIIFIDAGEVKEKGSYEKLMSQKGRFYKLAKQGS